MFSVCESEREIRSCVYKCACMCCCTPLLERVVSLHDVLRPVSQCLNSVFPSYVYVNEKKIIEPMIVFKQEIS